MTNSVSVNVLVDVRCDGDATGEKVRMIDIVFVSPSVSVLFALHEGLFVLVATRDAVWVVVIVLLASGKTRLHLFRPIESDKCVPSFGQYADFYKCNKTNNSFQRFVHYTKNCSGVKSPNDLPSLMTKTEKSVALPM